MTSHEMRNPLSAIVHSLELASSCLKSCKELLAQPPSMLDYEAMHADLGKATKGP